MHLVYSVGSLLHYNDFSAINVYVTLFWLLGNAFVIVCSHANVQMDRNEKRVVIKYLNLKGLSAAEFRANWIQF